MPSGSDRRGARIHTSCAVVAAPTLDRAFARWCLTVECDRPRRWAAAFSDPATRTAATTHDLAIGGASGGAAGPHASRLAAASHSSRPSIGML